MFYNLVGISEKHSGAGLMGWQWGACKQGARLQKATLLQPQETAAPLLQFGMHRLGKQDFNRLFGTDRVFPKTWQGN